MQTDPRRIGGVNVIIHLPNTLTLSDKEKIILKNAALTCPVAKSLHPDILQDVHFSWDA
jgi:putative redox protein